MTIASSLKSIALLLGFLLPLAVAAETLPEGATVNKDKCLGYMMDYKKYPKPVIAKVQGDMYQLYHLEDAWKNDAARKGTPLGDGILGPITWSWMQRFCQSFALDTTGNVLAAFPQRATEIATFSKTSSADAVTLISTPFAQWVVTHHNACGLNVQQILAQGSDVDLQKLLFCYRQPVAVPVPEEKMIEPLPLPHTLYVLRSNDFEDMAGVVAMASVEKDVIDEITGKHYSNKIAAQTELNALLADLPPEQSKKIISNISANLQEKTRYEITDQVLNNLSQQPISNALFDELTSLVGKIFVDQVTFAEAIRIAINKSLPAQLPVDDTVTAETSTGASSVSNQAVNEGSTTAQSISKLSIQIQVASQQTYVELDQATAAVMVSIKMPVADVVIELLKGIQDIEYPTAELIDLAIKNRILKASNICKLDESNTIDSQLIQLNAENIKLLRAEINNVIASDSKNSTASKNQLLDDKKSDNICNEDHVDMLKAYYAKRLKPVLEPIYSKAMPPYTGEPILWEGGKENCGCVRSQIQTVAYGIYPYWKWQVDKKKEPQAQIFDFSTFSRVAYFALTAKDDGALEQINPATNVRTLLNTEDNADKKFISKVRSYGGKMDWIIEKEFKLAPQLNSKEALNDFFRELRQQVQTLLKTQMEDSESRFLPLLSFGLAAQPTNGDGVTFYFKNYPKEDYAKEPFELFFLQLKKDLADFDKDRDNFNAVKSHTYVNIMITQSEFLNPESTFSRENLTRWIVNPDYENANNQEKDQEKGQENDQEKKTIQTSDTNPEIQDHFKSLVILLLEDPYYNALDKIYAVTNSTTRAFIAPLMFTDYSMLPEDKNNIGLQKTDERIKRLSYIHESFGGGGFWPMTEYENNSDGKDYRGFNRYIGEKFSPGYIEGSWWNEHFCSYLWTLIAIMNFWLLLALTYVVSVFYIYPHHCKKLPVYMRWLEHPLAVVILLLPVIVLWGYLFVVYPPLRTINLPNLLVLIVLTLVIWAAIKAVQKLNEPKPTRNSSQYKQASTIPTRMIYAPDPVDEIDDADVSGGNK